MTAEERMAYMKSSAHASMRWWEKPAEEQVLVRQKLSDSWANMDPEERAEVYARRGRGVHEAAVRRNALRLEV